MNTSDFSNFSFLIPYGLLVKIEAKCNELVCPTCGKTHTVKLEQPAAGMIQLIFPEGKCDDFVQPANDFVSAEIEDYLNNPSGSLDTILKIVNNASF